MRIYTSGPIHSLISVFRIVLLVPSISVGLAAHCSTGESNVLYSSHGRSCNKQRPRQRLRGKFIFGKAGPGGCDHQPVKLRSGKGAARRTLERHLQRFAAASIGREAAKEVVLPPPCPLPFPPSTVPWISEVAVPSRKRPPPIRMMSRQDTSRSKISNSGVVSLVSHTRPASSARRPINARPRPSRWANTRRDRKSTRLNSSH